MALLSKWLIESILEYGIIWQLIDIATILFVIYIIYKFIQFKNNKTANN